MYIDKFDPSWLAKLDLRSAELAVDQRLYLLIDGVFIPGIYRRLEEALPADSVRLLFELLPGCNDESRAVSPLLVDYWPNTPALAGILDACSGWPMVSAIVTSETIDRLAARLAAWCIVACDSQRFNFRFPDTRRLPKILDVLSAEQKEQMLGPACELRYIERVGRWKILPVTPVIRDPVFNPKLSDQQFGALVLDSDADAIIDLLHQRRVVPDAPPSETFASVQAALGAVKDGQLEYSDQIEWCKHCLRKPIGGLGELREEFKVWQAKLLGERASRGEQI